MSRDFKKEILEKVDFLKRGAELPETSVVDDPIAGIIAKQAQKVLRFLEEQEERVLSAAAEDVRLLEAGTLDNVFDFFGEQQRRRLAWAIAGVCLSATGIILSEKAIGEIENCEDLYPVEFDKDSAFEKEFVVNLPIEAFGIPSEFAIRLCKSWAQKAPHGRDLRRENGVFRKNAFVHLRRSKDEFTVHAPQQIYLYDRTPDLSAIFKHHLESEGIIRDSGDKIVV